MSADLDDIDQLMMADGTGLGVATVIAVNASKPRLWTVGLIPILVGVVVMVFAALNRRSGPDAAVSRP